MPKTVRVNRKIIQRNRISRRIGFVIEDIRGKQRSVRWLTHTLISRMQQKQE